ncbi:thioredoxin family protein [Flavobacterium agrisoli]|uniref:Thioredoxin family protein n=1 Tax=Flavobacterium agrisoli TaxID=2793066 RepID=A0A934UID1_9FLAO|nr:thioredoxin family protein [Flavobacterium agrisoli]MBK0368313.1 thioredoxin family protein [Flavobacterium agrisoli]
MKLFFKIASAVMLLACPFIALNAQTSSVDQSWELVKKKAAAEHKLILVDLYFTGCAPCAQMDKEVFPDPKVKAFLDANYITFKSDILKEEIAKKISMKYGVTGFPTFLFLNADGQLIDNAAGFKSADQFLALLQEERNVGQKGIFKKYSPKIQEQDYPEFYKSAYLENKRNVPFDVVDSYLQAQPSLLAEVPFVIITGLRVGNKYDDFFLKNIAVLSKDFGSASVSSHVYTIVKRKKIQFEKANDLESFKKLKEEVRPVFSEEEWMKFQDGLMKDFDVAKS